MALDLPQDNARPVGANDYLVERLVASGIMPVVVIPLIWPLNPA